METAESIRKYLTPQMWVASVDLKDAYFHVPMKESNFKFLRFTNKGVVYEYRALPFGLCTAPLVFTIVMRQVKVFLAKMGVTVNMYLDDWLISAASPLAVQKAVAITLKLCLKLGLRVNLTKSELVPMQNFKFVGYHYLLAEARVVTPADRVLKIHSAIPALLAQKSVSARDLMQIIGLLASAEKTTLYGRFHLRDLQYNLNRSWKKGQSYAKVITLTPQSKQALSWWGGDLGLLSQPLHPPPPPPPPRPG